jgi:hypothetical protein
MKKILRVLVIIALFFWALNVFWLSWKYMYDLNAQVPNWSEALLKVKSCYGYAMKYPESTLSDAPQYGYCVGIIWK